MSVYKPESHFKVENPNLLSSEAVVLIWITSHVNITHYESKLAKSFLFETGGRYFSMD